MGIKKKLPQVMSASLVVMVLFTMVLPSARAEVTRAWVARYDGLANSYASARAVATGPTGNVYVTGFFYNGGNSYDYITMAYDPSGNQLWMASYDGPAHGSDSAESIAVDNEGTVYVSGKSPGTGTRIDYATVAYDSSGTELWVARYNGPANTDDWAHATATDGEGTVYVTGRSYGIGTGNDYATVAYDSSGTELWVARYDGPAHSSDYAVAIDTDNTGNVYTTGRSSRGGTSFDFATVAYDSSGNQLWVARYGPEAEASAISTDHAGNILVTGVASWNFATVAYDSSGNQLWAAQYDGPAQSFDYAKSIATDHKGNVYVTGDSVSADSDHDYDFATVAYDSSGNRLWVERYDGPRSGQDLPYSIATDGLGNVYVVGQSVGIGTGEDFTTIKYASPKGPNSPPAAAKLVSPLKGAIDVSVPVTCRWNASTDPDGDTLAYELYVCDNQSFSGCDTPEHTIAMNGSILKSNGIYLAGTGAGFIFMGIALGGASRKRMLALVLALLFISGLFLLACGGGSDTRSISDYSYEVTSLQPDTTYYWKVVAVDGTDETPSSIWDFRTE